MKDRKLIMIIVLGVIIGPVACGGGKKVTIAKIDTAKGSIQCVLRDDAAPQHVKNFIKLSEEGFYNNLTFHRVEDWVIQGGDPQGNGSGGPGYTIPAEIKLVHQVGALAAARLSDQVNPERSSSGSQFYITKNAASFLDGAYTVFGYCDQESVSVVNSISRGEIIQKVSILSQKR